MKTFIAILAVLTLTVPLAAQTWEASAGADAAAQIARVRVLVRQAPPRPSAALRPGPAHEPAALAALLDLVSESARLGRTPVVLFDLDDTLIDTGYRQRAIIQEYAAQANVQTRFPDAASRMSATRYADLRYNLGDTLQALGVAEIPAILPDLTAFWAARFFENAYLSSLDQANPGGVDFVREVLRRGGKAVYLTGRWEAMRPGTEQSMARMGYPAADGRNVLLMMKPDRAQSDIDFKKVAFEDIAKLGEVVGGFENEPANVNAYQERFRTGLYIFLDTRHSTTAAVPLPSIYWVGDFQYGQVLSTIIHRSPFSPEVP